jgi:polyhydroxyalkanoate synthase
MSVHKHPSADKNSAAAQKQEAQKFSTDNFAQNIVRVVERSQQLMQEFMLRNGPSQEFGMGDPLHISNAFLELYTRLMTDPIKLFEIQMDWWNEYLQLMQNVTERFIGQEPTPYIQPDSKDRRFKDKAWQESVVFDFIKQSYLVTARLIQRSVQGVEGIDPHTMQKIDFYTRQFVDAMAPSNFLMTNPEVLKATIESEGENLVRGLEHMLEDLERGKGRLKISMTNPDAFEIGRNIACAPGKVVFQNDLMQLIQYEPTTEKVFEVPLLIIPAWINKYYILDLQEDNSFVRWLVAQGHTVFVISWVNPDERHANKQFEDYMLEGPLAALTAIEKFTGSKKVNAMGYCLGGTLLAITLSYLHAKKQGGRIASATYLTTMLDFSEAGEISVFIDEEQLASLEERMNSQGYLDGSDMATTFNMLRANDLIWSFVVNNYLLGKDPFPFDLLYWNSDSTRLPAAMHSYYLRNMYQQNRLIVPNALSMGGTGIDLGKVKTPTYLLSTREDHIAPWKSTYAATQLFSGEKRFVLAASGHVAGVINPPSRGKYCFWVNNGNTPDTPDSWLEQAKEMPGSWWPDWQAWVAPLSGAQVKARKPGSDSLIALEPAPGSYAKAVG